MMASRMYFIISTISTSLRIEIVSFTFYTGVDIVW